MDDGSMGDRDGAGRTSALWLVDAGSITPNSFASSANTSASVEADTAS
jgi:hypothetical protein